MKSEIYLEGTKLFYKNGVQLGEILMKEDGFYDFWPNLNGGHWPAHLLHAIAKKLDEMNAPWEKEIEAHFAGEH